jgi:hypothetical protein
MASVLVRGNTEYFAANSNNALFNADVETVLKRTTVHELTHQWQANPGPYNDHCYPQVAYTSTAPYPTSTASSPPAGLEFCLMAYADGNTPQMPAPWNTSLSISMVQYLYRSGLTHYHVPAGSNAFHSEYLAIRQASDPWKP